MKTEEIISGNTEKMTAEQIAESVNEIIEEMWKTENEYCVNWADLKVNEVSKQQMLWPKMQDEEFIIIVDEADPDEHSFQEEIMSRFFKKHGFYITVQTEW